MTDPYMAGVVAIAVASPIVLAIGWALDRWFALDETPLYADQPADELTEERAARIVKEFERRTS